ncbi:MAG: DUF520 family protein [Acidobacteria bacterium]|nr:DUF520 family protein [Acidobacteriota bacterium]
MPVSGLLIMAQQNTFDIVSKIDHSEVVNAINQALKEVQARFDSKGSISNIELKAASDHLDFG